jgi:putative alpha-1,2-mannosidase
MMKKIILITLSFYLCGFYSCLNEKLYYPNANRATKEKLISLVDTRAGSGGLMWAMGHTTPAVTTPNGMVKLGPDTKTLGKIWSSSGYYYGDAEIAGFSHSHLSGTGAVEGGILRVVPATQLLTAKELSKNVLIYSHSAEIAEPGFYSVDILNRNIRANFTTTDHVGMHEYYFPKNKTPYLYIDLASHLLPDGNVEIISVEKDLSKNRILGSVILKDGFSGRYGGLKIYFCLYSKAAQSFEEISKNIIALKYLPSEEPVSLFVGLSHVSIEGAVQNLSSEVLAEDKNFESVKKLNQESWEKILNSIIVEGNLKEKRIFYSSLYRSFFMPSLFSDVSTTASGKKLYVGFDKKEHSSFQNYYSDMSLWDTFRTVHPLYNLIAPALQYDVVTSLLAMFEQSKALPRWAAAGGHTGSMLGWPANIVIAESYLKGIDFDKETAANAMIASTEVPLEGTQGQECLKEYNQFGYCPSDLCGKSVSLTLEYSYADYSTGLFLQSIRHPKADFYLKRSKSYLSLWSKERNAFVPKDSSGKFEEDFNINDSSYLNITKSAAHFAEGSPSQWRWYVPFDGVSLSKLFDSNFILELQNFFLNSNKVKSSAFPGPHYWHGNEPSIHTSFLFAKVDRPDLTQVWSRWVLNNRYKETSDALDGDDDGGTLSSWYVFAALGFYPVAGTTEYILGSPLFSSAKINMTQGRVLNIRTKKSKEDDIYVCKVSINGRGLSSPWFDHSAIQKGGEIVFYMTSKPCAWNSHE